LGEVESVLRRHEAVGEAAAAVMQQGRGGQLIAFAVLKPGQETGSEVLRQYLRQRLPQAVVPAQVQLVPVLPKLPNGKLDRHRLLEDCQAATPYTSSIGRKPCTETETLLVKIWSAVFGREEVGLTDDFWEMGGDSIIAMQLAARLKVAFSLDIMVRDIFEARTVARLSDFISKRPQVMPETEVAVATSGDMAART
jgi:acyl carrier protein